MLAAPHLQPYASGVTDQTNRRMRWQFAPRRAGTAAGLAAVLAVSAAAPIPAAAAPNPAAVAC
jgi:hypothetical protein